MKSNSFGRKKVCITGGAGMIGSSLVKMLISEGHEVIVIDNLWRGKLDNLKENGQYIIDIKKDFINLDLSDSNNIDVVSSIILNVDIVIHLADIVAGIGYVFNKQYEIFKLNNAINSNLFKATIDSNIEKLIYVGTACSFPLEIQNSLESELKDENLFPANPESAYGWSKLIGQLELRYLSEIADFEINTLMLHNVYGSNCEFEGERTQVIPSLINRVIEAKEGSTIAVWGSGNQGRAFIFVQDVVEAITKTIFKNNLPEYMQIGPTYCTSIKELVKLILEISGKKLNIYYDISKPEGDRGRLANIDKAERYLDWIPKINLKEGLNLTYHWIQSEKDES